MQKIPCFCIPLFRLYFRKLVDFSLLVNPFDAGLHGSLEHVPQSRWQKRCYAGLHSTSLLGCILTFEDKDMPGRLP